ncbi:phage tail tape measure protein [Microbispora sp. CA-102843]|uniref:phage tail tape measure protein n=1 Tax=Microbispora sp. CA-102843 TaxID=3239952 RepID=UPI003D8E8AB3
MALSLGELVGYIDLEDKGFAGGLQNAGRGLDRLQSSTSSSMSSIEGTVSRALSQIEADITDGLDPAAAIKDLDKLERALDDGLKSMLDEADRFADELDKAIDDAYDGLDDKARKGGEDASRGFTDGVGDGGKAKLSGIGDGFMSTLKGLGWAAAGAAIGALLMKGLEGAMDAQEAKAKLFAQVGATEPEMKRLGGAAGKAYAAGYGENLSEVTDAIRAVVQHIDGMRGASENTLKTMAERAMDTATVMDEDVGGVTRAVSQMLRTGLAKSAKEAFDILVKGAQNGVNKSEDLLDTFNEYGTQFRDLGLNAKEALGLMSQGLKAGARDSDTVADALKEINIRVRGMDTNAVPALQKLGLNAHTMADAFSAGGKKAHDAFGTILQRLREVKDPTERYQLAVALFGTKAEDMAKSIDKLDLSKAGQEIGKVGGAAKSAGDQLHDTAANKLESFKRGLQQNLVDFLGGTVLPKVEEFANKFDLAGLGEKVGPALEEVKGLFSEVFGSIGQWIEDHKGKIDEWSGKIGGAAEDVKGILTDVRAFWDQWGSQILDGAGMLIDGVTSQFSGGWKLVKGIWDTAVGLLTGDWEKFKSGILSIGSGLWDTLNSMTLGALGKFTDGISEKLSLAGKYFSGLKDDVLGAVKNAKAWLVKTGKDIVTGFWNGLQSMGGWIKGKVTSFFGGMVPDWVKQALDSHSPSRVFMAIGGDTVTGFVQGMLQQQPRAQMTAKAFAKLMKDAFAVDIKNAPDPLVDWIKRNNDHLHDLADKREEIIKRIADAKKYANDIAKQMVDFASVADLGLEKGDGAQDMISGLNEKLTQIKKFANDIKVLAERGLNKTTLSQIINAGPEKGLSLAEMLVGADGAELKAINKAQGQINKVSKQMGKTSADALYDVGKKAGDGFLKGLQGKLTEVESMMAKIAKAVVDAAKKQLGVKSPSRVFMSIGDNTMLGYIQGVLGQQQATVSAVAGVVGKAAATASRVPGLVPGAMAGPSSAPAYGAEYGQGHGQVYGAGPGGVVVNMPNAVIREQADVGRIGAEFAFKYRARG